MPYDPNFPVEHTEILAEDFRDQFHGLKELIDAIPVGPPGPEGPMGPEGAVGPQGPPGPPGEVTTSDLLAAKTEVLMASSANSNAVGPLFLTVSDPPTQFQVQALAAKLDELIIALHRA